MKLELIIKCGYKGSTECNVDKSSIGEDAPTNGP